MAATSSSTLEITLPSDREILMTRVFDAPSWLVFEALTVPEHVVNWWGPCRSKLVVCEIDFRIGGSWRYVLEFPNGVRSTFTGTFLEIAKPERLVCQECYVEPSLGNPEWQTTLTLTEQNGKTTLTSRVVHPSKEARDGHLNSGMESGAKETFDRLSDLLADNTRMEREIELVRIFDAPRELVYEAWTKPEHMTQWWGPGFFSNHSCKLDVRPGGEWEITMRSPDGQDFRCAGVYSEVVKPERLVFTNDALGADGQPLLKGFTTVLLEAQGSKTKLTLKTRAVGLVPFAPMMLRGMREGWVQSLDSLAKHLSA
jgi:uncharacterized protein YndB with AHSA1/START domain